MMLAALTLMWGCSSSDDNTSTTGTGQSTTKWQKAVGTADWKIDWSANEETPDWTAPQPGDYESWMILMVTLQPELVPYSTEKDLMAVFIGNEIRAVARPAIALGNTKDVTFILKVLGNEESDKAVHITLSYYCSQLRQTFTLTGTETFVPEKVYGVDEIYMPTLLAGSAKYPVQMPLSLQMPRIAQDVLQPAAGDLIAMMVNGECRGVATIGENLFLAPYSLTVYARVEGEQASIYYYNVREKAIWNTGTVFTITSSAQTVNVDYY